jgi:hypothetical protein
MYLVQLFGHPDVFLWAEELPRIASFFNTSRARPCNINSSPQAGAPGKSLFYPWGVQFFPDTKSGANP